MPYKNLVDEQEAKSRYYKKNKDLIEQRRQSYRERNHQFVINYLQGKSLC